MTDGQATSTSDEPVSVPADQPDPRPCAGCGDSEQGSLIRAWRFIGAAIGLALAALALAGAAWVRAGPASSGEAPE